jgi:hypothetical protein
MRAMHRPDEALAVQDLDDAAALIAALLREFGSDRRCAVEHEGRRSSSRRFGFIAADLRTIDASG